MGNLDKEFKFYRENKEKFLSEYKGKFIVIKGEKVIGIYQDKMEAIQKTQEEHELGTFLVHEVVEDDVSFYYSGIRLRNRERAA